MKSFSRSYLLLLAFLLGGCSVTRWSVTEEQIIDPSFIPEVLHEEEIILISQYPTPEYPLAIFSLNRVIDRKYQLLEIRERNIQQYRPRWFLTALGVSAATVAVLAANTSILPSALQSDQKVLLNIAAPLTAALSLSVQKPVGDPIFTGETEAGRPSGFFVESDTLRITEPEVGTTADVSLNYEGEIIGSRSGILLENGEIELNLALLTEELLGTVRNGSAVEVTIRVNGISSEFRIPISTFLSPYVTVTEPVAQLRSSPVISDLNILAEVAGGSRFSLAGVEPEGWYRVRFGGSEVFLPESSSETEWRSVFVSGIPDVFEFQAVPFGQIDVERSVPVLKEHNPEDRALILTNAFSGDSEPRQYLDRDHDLFLFYMRSGFQLNNEQISVIEMDRSGRWKQRLSEISVSDSTGTLYVYLSGDAFINTDRTLGMLSVEENSEDTSLNEILYRNIQRIGTGAVVLFADLQFMERSGEGRLDNFTRNESIQILRNSVQPLTEKVPESAILFSNRPGQRSSLYAGFGVENKRHHIFNYYLAQALQQRKTRFGDIVEHMESNVDYISRRIHDKAQEIQAFGNVNLQVTGR